MTLVARQFGCARRPAASLLLLALVGLATLTSCGGSELMQVQGSVLVDGAPLDVGTIHFQSQDNPTGSSAGAAVTAGKFALSPQDRLPPGKYRVAITGSKKTGRTFADPQRGPVEELAPLQVANSPHELDLTSDNAGDLQFKYSSITTR